jgi:hypothetical protein
MRQRPALGFELPPHPAAWVAERESRVTTAVGASANQSSTARDPTGRRTSRGTT